MARGRPKKVVVVEEPKVDLDLVKNVSTEMVLHFVSTRGVTPTEQHVTDIVSIAKHLAKEIARVG